MNNVKRYDLGHVKNFGPAIVVQEYGDYVHYADYKRLLDQVEAVGAGGVSGQRITGYVDQHHRDSAELRRVCAQRDRLREALSSVSQYGSDTLSGRTDGPDDRTWQREAVREMTRRARAALAQEQS